jgi:hypothetical protein
MKGIRCFDPLMTTYDVARPAVPGGKGNEAMALDAGA